MMRPVTCLCILLAGGSGLYVYQAKHQAQLLDREISRVVKQADAARERAGVLRAEYMGLNDPSRLETLVGEHLDTLKATAPGQFTTWAELEKRLPPVGAPATEAPPLEPDAPAAKLPEPAPEAKPIAAVRPAASAPAAPAAEPAKPVVPVAAARPPAAPRPPVLAQRPAAAPVSLTAMLPAASSAPAPARLAPPAPVAATSAPPPRAMPTYTPPASVVPGAMARIGHPEPAEHAAAPVGSSLGMARSQPALPPLVRTSTATIWQPGGAN